MEIKETFISINQAANELSVTPATINNWIKTGRIVNLKQQDDCILLNVEEIRRIIEQINKEHYFLKTRRNKSFVSGLSVPLDYISNATYQNMINDIVNISVDISDFRILLLEVILELLNVRNKIDLQVEKFNGSYIQAYQQALKNGETCLYSILKEILDLKQIHVSDYDFEILTKIHNQIKIPWVKDQDFLGFVYMSLTSIRDRKRAGSYYTSYHIVDELTNEALNFLNEKKIDYCNLTIYDPCCGSGNFLIHLFLKFKDLLISKGFSTYQAEKLLLENILYGNDIDPVAVTLTKLNLILCSNFSPSEIMTLNITNGNTLANNNHQLKPTYNVIIGNPPWGSVISSADRAIYFKTYSSAKGACESFSLFLEKSLELLEPNGILAFVLPEAFLNISSHRTIRHIILSDTTVCSIKMRGNDFAKVFSPIITLIVKKKKPSPKHFFSIKTLNKSAFSNQRDCLNNPDYIITGQTREETRLVNHMKTLPGVKFLKNSAAFAMGIVTGNNKRYIFNQCPPNGELILKGINIYKFKYYPGSSYIVYNPANFQQVASDVIYRSNEKIIYRFINKTLVFAYDSNKLLSLNSANVIVPAIDNLEVKYILAILNSRAIQAFYSISFNSIKVLKQYLESLPIPAANEADQNIIISYVDQLMQTSDSHLIEELYELIDNLIMSLFDLSIKEQQLVRDIVGETKYLLL